MHQFIISEEDIFKHLVKFDGSISDSDILRKMKWFLNRVPINIFNDEYHILYKAIETAIKYESPLTIEMLMQFLQLNIRNVINNDEITLFKEKDITQLQREEEVSNHTLATFETLCDIWDDSDDTTFKSYTEFYVQTWCTNYYSVVINKQTEILNGELRIGKTNYIGIEGARAYFNKADAILSKLISSSSMLLSQVIDTSTQTYEEIEQITREEETGKIVTSTGIPDIDTAVELRKGEVALIQGGSGVGKTRSAVGLYAYNAVTKYKQNVLFISLEQKSTRILPMFQALHTLEKHGQLHGVNDKSILNNNYPIEHKPLVEDAKRDFIENPEYGRIKIVSSSVEANNLRSTLEEIYDSGFLFDVVVLDYFGLLETSKDRYADYSDAINRFKDDAKSFKGQGFAGILLNQLTKDAEYSLNNGDYELVIKTGGSETQYLPRASDYILTLHRTVQMQNLNTMIIYLGKVRNAVLTKDDVEVDTALGYCAYFPKVS